MFSSSSLGVLVFLGFPALTAFLFGFCVGLSVLGVSSLGVGWGVLGVSSFSPPFPPPPCCLLRLASSLAARCLRKLGGSARNGPDPSQPSV